MRVFRLSPHRRALLIEAVIRLWLARLSLSLLPFGVWRGWLAAMMQPITIKDDREMGLAWWKDAAWAVDAARRAVPNATCLVQAMGAHGMGVQRGYTPRLFIGVAAKANAGSIPQLDAHAWLEYADVVIIGSQMNMDRFSRLPQFPSERGASMNFR